MGKLKKAGVNEKAVEAKQGKEAKKSARKDADATASEDAEWAAAGEGKQSKGIVCRHPLPHTRPCPDAFLRRARECSNPTAGVAQCEAALPEPVSVRCLQASKSL